MEGRRADDARANERSLGQSGRLLGEAAALRRLNQGSGSDDGDDRGQGETALDVAARNVGVKLIDPSFLTKLKPLLAGSEAVPCLDEAQGVVYKVFKSDPITGKVGWKLKALRDSEGNWHVEREPATILDTLEKLALLHIAGGLPTEIVGLTARGEVMAKQPYAEVTHGGGETRARAVAAMCGTQINDVNMDGVRVFWAFGKPWLLGDLHAYNIMRDFAGQDRVMDALTLEVPGAMISENRAVERAVAESLRMMESGESNDPTQGMLFSSL